MNRLIFIICLFVSITAVAQSDNDQQSNKEQKLFFSPSVGIGFFYPDDVNRIIESNYTSTTNSDMYLYFHIGANGSYFLAPFIELQAGAEFAFAPKFVAVDDNIDTYFFRRITPNAKLNFHIPAGKKVTISIGPGISYSSLKFNAPGGSIENTDIGYSIQAGAMIRFSKFAYAPSLVFNNIMAEGKNHYIISEPDLSFIGVQINNTFYF